MQVFPATLSDDFIIHIFGKYHADLSYSELEEKTALFSKPSGKFVLTFPHYHRFFVLSEH
jgi:hypothetical protein